MLPYYGYDTDVVIDPFDEKATDPRRLEECDLTGKNVVCISTLEHIGRAEYGNQDVNTHEAFEGLMQIIDQADNYFITIPIGYNTPLDSSVQRCLQSNRGYASNDECLPHTHNSSTSTSAPSWISLVTK